MSIDSPSSEPDSPLRNRMLQILGALLFTVGCQNTASEDTSGEDTTDNRSPVGVRITRKGPKLRVRVPRKHEAKPKPAKAEDCPYKGNINKKGDKLLHYDGCPDYPNVKINKPGEKCFTTVDEATKAGWRIAGNCK